MEMPFGKTYLNRMFKQIIAILLLNSCIIDFLAKPQCQLLMTDNVFVLFYEQYKSCHELGFTVMLMSFIQYQS